VLGESNRQIITSCYGDNLRDDVTPGRSKSIPATASCVHCRIKLILWRTTTPFRASIECRGGGSKLAVWGHLQSTGKPLHVSLTCMLRPSTVPCLERAQLVYPNPMDRYVHHVTLAIRTDHRLRAMQPSSWLRPVAEHYSSCRGALVPRIWQWIRLIIGSGKYGIT
jgi:hypothetical protein